MRRLSVNSAWVRNALAFAASRRKLDSTKSFAWPSSSSALEPVDQIAECSQKSVVLIYRRFHPGIHFLALAAIAIWYLHSQQGLRTIASCPWLLLENPEPSLNSLGVDLSKVSPSSLAALPLGFQEMSPQQTYPRRCRTDSQENR
jgi:hypothetical protein